MAGSYNHCVAEDGKLLRYEDFHHEARNPFAHEAITEMYGMIWWLAEQNTLGKYGRPGPDEFPFWTPAEWVERARDSYERGLAVSPGTDGTLREEDDNVYCQS